MLVSAYSARTHGHEYTINDPAPGTHPAPVLQGIQGALVAQAQVPGVSLASVAISHGVNPNVMQCWVADANDRALPSAGTAQAVLAQPDAEDALVLHRDADVATCAPAAAASFVPVKVEAPAPAQLHIELVRDSVHVKVSWPLTAAALSRAGQERHALVRRTGAGQHLAGPGAPGMSAPEMRAMRGCKATMAVIGRQFA
jgi:transposase-like protein